MERGLPAPAGQAPQPDAATRLKVFPARSTPGQPASATPNLRSIALPPESSYSSKDAGIFRAGPVFQSGKSVRQVSLQIKLQKKDSLIWIKLESG
jgi:hypothetical protein